MFWMRAYPLLGKVGGGWAHGIRVFWALWNGIEPIGECHLGPKKLEFYWAAQAAKAWIKISCTGKKSPTNQPRKDPRQLYSVSVHLPQFQQSAGAAPLWTLWLSRLCWLTRGKWGFLQRLHEGYCRFCTSVPSAAVQSCWLWAQQESFWWWRMVEYKY
jgi:hypothetical protein